MAFYTKGGGCWKELPEFYDILRPFFLVICWNTLEDPFLNKLFINFQGNPVGQSGLGMAYLYGKGVQMVCTSVFMIFVATVIGVNNCLDQSHSQFSLLFGYLSQTLTSPDTLIHGFVASGKCTCSPGKY